MSKENSSDLRHQAEELLSGRELRLENLEQADLAKIAHELAVHQVELEIQNEELRQTRTAAEEARDRYLDLFDFAPLGYFTLDEHSRIAEVNLTGCRLLQIDRGKLLNKHFTEFIAPEETDSFYLNRRTAVKNNTRHSFELTMRQADGTPFYAQLDTIGVGQDRLRITVSDITERKKTEEALRESEEKWRGLFAILPVGISILNGNLAVTDSNPALDRILEIPPIGSVEAPYSRRKYLRGDGTPMPPEEFPSERAVREHRVIPSTEIGVLREDGTVIWTELISAPLPKSGCVNVITDITERKHQEKMLQDALEEKDVLLREITHRVKNNLAAVIGLMNMRARSSSHPAVQGMVQDLTGHIRSMALAHEMLLHSGTYKYIKMDNYLETLLADVPRFFEREHPITVTVTVDDTRLDMDTAVPVGMLASELVTNALKHAFPEGKNNLGGDDCAISVSLKQSDGRVLLVVADNGVGLPPGFDWKKTTSMGMHLLHMLGEHQLRGIIEIDNTHGTTFQLNFPFILRNIGAVAADE